MTNFLKNLLLRSRSRKNKEPKATNNQVDIEKEYPVKKASTAIKVADTTTFWDEFSKALGYIYFGHL